MERTRFLSSYKFGLWMDLLGEVGNFVCSLYLPACYMYVVVIVVRLCGGVLEVFFPHRQSTELQRNVTTQRHHKELRVTRLTCYDGVNFVPTPRHGYIFFTLIFCG